MILINVIISRQQITTAGDHSLAIREAGCVVWFSRIFPVYHPATINPKGTVSIEMIMATGAV